MPRPAILPVPDRAALFAGGEDFTTWLNYSDTPDNAERIRDLYATTTVPDAARAALAALTRDVRVIAIAETWCGDVVRHTPVLMRLAECSPHIQVRFIKREAAPDYFARFLTNGGEAIPKYVFCNAEFVEVGHWGPMSSTPRLMIAQGKGCNDGKTARQKVAQFYEADANREAIAEMVALAQTAAFPGF